MTVNLTVQATNGQTSSLTLPNAVINASGTIPLSYNDARFSGNSSASPTAIAIGGTLLNKSITSGGGPGELTASIVCNGSNTVRNCRVNSREAVRIAGGGTFLIDNCYLEATGSGADHADVIQTYSPGDRGTLRITNTSIVAHTTAATAGLFVADDWTGTVDLENVVIRGGPYGIRIHPDVSGDIIVRFKNVFCVGPFGADSIWIDERTLGGHKNYIGLWDNVRNATIVNGVIVPGSLIPQPFVRPPL